MQIWGNFWKIIKLRVNSNITFRCKTTFFLSQTCKDGRRYLACRNLVLKELIFSWFKHLFLHWSHDVDNIMPKMTGSSDVSTSHFELASGCLHPRSNSMRFFMGITQRPGLVPSKFKHVTNIETCTLLCCACLFPVRPTAYGKLHYKHGVKQCSQLW